MSALSNMRGRLLLGLILGVVVVVAMSVYADFTKMVEVLRDFEWLLLPFVLLFTMFNYVLRLYKWDVYLRMIGAKGVAKLDSLLIFFSGMAMAMTPGKVGEVLKSYLLKQVRGTPVAASAPIVMAERLTDGIAMLVLAAAGLVLFDYGRLVMIGIAVFVVVFLVIFQNRALGDRFLTRLEQIGFLSKRIHHFHAFYDSSYELFRSRNLLFGVGIGVISWSGEVIAFALVMMGLGYPFSPLLLIICAFILSASSLIGSVTLLPGGLGATDATIAGMLLFLVPRYLTEGPAMTQDIAVAATLLIRFATLWFGVGLGLVALVVMQRRLGRSAIADEAIEREDAPVPVGAGLRSED